MTLEFTRDWRGNIAGQVKEVDNGIGEAYITRGVARLVEKKQLNPQTIANTKRGKGH
jgi:hypothetical protein